MISDELIKAYALENAILHDGKAKVDAVLAKLFRHGLKKEDIADMLKRVDAVVAAINSLSLEQQKAMFDGLKVLLPEKKHERKLELPNVKGKVVMRIAPFPSGPLHIGNAFPCLLNDYFVKKYCGSLLLVIDDTIGSEEKKIVPEAYKLIPEGLEWLGVEWHELLYKSDRLEHYYKYGEKLIEKGAAYVCFCKQEVLRKNREKGIECEHRAFSIEKNLEEFRNMLEGKYKEGEAVVRLKTSMRHKNPAFRDRVLFRISEKEHPRVGKKFRVWPMMEMTWAVDNYLLNITHVLRGKELMIETEMENYIFDIFGWPKPEFIHTGLLNIKEVKISKSKSQKEIEKGIYFGWDDPRTWSLQSLKRRGFRPEAIREFCLSFGLTQSEVEVPDEVLYSFNRKYVEESNRYFFVANPIAIEIDNAPNLKARIPLHPDKPERGYRKLWTDNEFFISLDDYQQIRKAKEGSMFRLMYLFNFYKKSERFHFHSIEYDKKLNAKMIHWLPGRNNLNARVLMPNGEWVNGLLESNAKLKPDAIAQFERFGFVRLDAIKKLKADEVDVDMEVDIGANSGARDGAREANRVANREDKRDIKPKREKLYEFWYCHP